MNFWVPFDTLFSCNAITESGLKISGVCFEKDEFPEILKKSQEGNKFSIIYYPQINEYNGKKDLRITIKRIN